MQSIGICSRVFQIVVRGGGRGGGVNYLTSGGESEVLLRGEIFTK